MRTAVLIPCYNEAVTIADVVSNFRQALPDSVIYVYDNNSTDDTKAKAREAGAIVRSEPRQGKGNVVRRMFADIEADIYVLVDGDDTYDASSAGALVKKLIDESLDMVNASRRSENVLAYRPGHVIGNKLITGFVKLLFGNAISDILSGYRVFSRRFVKSFPAIASGFEIETEFSVHALLLKMPLAEVETFYKERPEGSFSKLNTYKDGLRIVFTILDLLRELKPLTFFGLISITFFLVGMIIGIPVFAEFLETGLVPKLPSAVLASGLMILASLTAVTGIILNSLARARLEAKRLSYLSIVAVGAYKDV